MTATDCPVPGLTTNPLTKGIPTSKIPTVACVAHNALLEEEFATELALFIVPAAPATNIEYRTKYPEPLITKVLAVITEVVVVPSIRLLVCAKLLMAITPFFCVVRMSSSDAIFASYLTDMLRIGKFTEDTIMLS